MNKRILSIITALVLCLTFLPGTARAEEVDALTSPLNFTGEGGGSASGAGYTWDIETRTLTLNGLNLQIKNERVLSSTLGAISLPADSKIVLEGTSNITVEKVQRGSYGGISFTENLTVTGTGRLNISVVSSGAGFYSNNLETSSLRLENGTINVTGGADYTVGIISGKVSICGAEVNIKNVRHGIGVFYSSGAELVEVSDGSLKIEGDGIASNGEGISLHRRNSDTTKFKLSITGGSVDISNIVEAVNFYDGCVAVTGGSLHIHDLVKNDQGYSWAFSGYTSGIVPQINLTGGDISISGCRNCITLNGDTQEGAIHIADSLNLAGLFTTYRVISEENINQNEVLIYGDYTLPESIKFPKEQNGDWIIFMNPNSQLTIPNGVVFDLSEVLRDSKKDFIDLSAGSVIVNGTIKLPESITGAQLAQWKLSGPGTIMIGNGIYYLVTVTGGTADKSFAKAGETVTLTPEAGQGKVFRSWTTSPSVTITDNTFTMPGQAVAVTAQYDYTVTFDSQGGSTVESQTVESGGKAQAPETVPTLDGFLFDGWYTDTDYETAYDFDSAVTAPLTLYAKWRKVLPDPPTGEGNTRYNLVMDEGVETVPDGLKDKYQTTDALENAMKVKITEAAAGVSEDNIAVYDVTLLVSDDGGQTWTAATKENFPTGGLTITLPYPEGTNSSYVFTVVHMFTTNDFDKTPGNTETPAVTNTSAGIRFTVTGLSPVSVGWKEPASSNGSGGGGSASTYVVTIEKSEHGKVTASPSSAVGGSRITLTVSPDEGYETGTLTVTDRSGKTLDVTDKGGGTYTFIMPGGSVSVRAVFNKITADYEACARDSSCPIWPFTDTDANAWYHDGVHYCLGSGLMSGYGDHLFGPNAPLSRAQFAQILYNREGRPAVNDLVQFVDVSGKEWYAEAVRWAASVGVVSGYGNGRFGPDDNITREQLALMLWRCAGSPAVAGGTLEFTDADAGSEYALEALCWAVENGIVTGRDGGVLDPQGQATRAEAAVMLMRYWGK